MTESKDTTQSLYNATSDWTAKGYRLVTSQWSHMLTLSVQTEELRFASDERVPFILGQVVVFNSTLRTDADRFVAHCFAFWDDAELTALALAQLKRLYDSLHEAKGTAPPLPQGPQGAAVN